MRPVFTYSTPGAPEPRSAGHLASPHVTFRPLALVLPLVLLAACDSSSSTPATPPAALPEQCRPQDLATLTPGTLTLATAPVTSSPWVVDPEQEEGLSPDPTSGQGYDAAVGYALAERLGFSREDVTWTAVPFADAVGEGEKAFDVNVNQATIRPERAEVVALSTPYYVVRQALVAREDTPGAALADLADLTSARIAVVDGSPGQAAVGGLSAEVVVVPDPDEARRAVSEDRVDALVTDFPNAVVLDRDETQLVGGELVGQLPRTEGAEEYALVLGKDSALLSCVDAALGMLREEGVLDELEQRWLTEHAGAPLLG